MFGIILFEPSYLIRWAREVQKTANKENPGSPKKSAK